LHQRISLDVPDLWQQQQQQQDQQQDAAGQLPFSELQLAGAH